MNPEGTSIGFSAKFVGKAKGSTMALKKRKGALRKKWGCPLTRNRSSWCFALCDPFMGEGECGRHAYHAYMGRTAQAILDHKQRKEDELED